MSGVTNEEDKKPTEQGGAHINLKVKGQDGNEVFFRIKRSTQLKKLMNAYCDRQSVDFNSIAFLFDGRRLRSDQTPDEGMTTSYMTIFSVDLEMPCVPPAGIQLRPRNALCCHLPIYSLDLEMPCAAGDWCWGMKTEES
ncbi:hypothetical protein AHAS_Ahas07G0007200 [Arachis hypogaea]